MTTSLAKQLAAITQQDRTFGGLAASQKYKASLLFSDKEAADIDNDAIFDLAQQGLYELIKQDSSFTKFQVSLFGEKTKQFDRGLKTAQENERIDMTITQFLRFLSPYFLHPPAHKALEWLIRRFRINELNIDSVMECILPYHETPMFVRMLQIMRIKGDSKWDFLSKTQENGVTVGRDFLAQRCRTDTHMISIAFQFIKWTKRNDPNANSKKFSCIVNFFTLLSLDFLETYKQLTPDVVTFIVPLLIQGVKFKDHGEVQIGCCMVLSQIASRCQLSDEAKIEIVDGLIANISQEYQKHVLLFLNYFFEAQAPILLSESSFKALISFNNIVKNLKEIKAKYDYSSLLKELLKLLKSHSLSDDSSKKLLFEMMDAGLCEKGDDLQSLELLDDAKLKLFLLLQRPESAERIKGIAQLAELCKKGLYNKKNYDFIPSLVKQLCFDQDLNTRIAVLCIPSLNSLLEQDFDGIIAKLLDSSKDSRVRQVIMENQFPNLSASAFDSCIIDVLYQGEEKELAIMKKLFSTGCKKESLFHGIKKFESKNEVLEKIFEKISDIKQVEQLFSVKKIKFFCNLALFKSNSNSKQPMALEIFKEIEQRFGLNSLVKLADEEVCSLLLLFSQKGSLAYVYNLISSHLYLDVSKKVLAVLVKQESLKSVLFSKGCNLDVSLSIFSHLNCQLDEISLAYIFSCLYRGTEDLKRLCFNIIEKSVDPKLKFNELLKLLITSKVEIMNDFNLLKKLLKSAKMDSFYKLFFKRLLEIDIELSACECILIAFSLCVGINEKKSFALKCFGQSKSLDGLVIDVLFEFKFDEQCKDSLKKFITLHGYDDELLSRHFSNLDCAVQYEIIKENISALGKFEMTDEFIKYAIDEHLKLFELSNSQKKAKSGEYADLQELESLLEHLSKMNLVNGAYSSIVACLFDLLSSLMAQSATCLYLKQIIIGLLQRIPFDSSIATSAYRVDLLVQLLRSSEEFQLHNQVLTLLCKVAQVVKIDDIVENLLVVFTFMGSSHVKRDDEYTFQTMEQTIKTIIPLFLKEQSPARATRSKKKSPSAEEVKIARQRELLEIFVNSISHIPKHRQVSLFYCLLETVGFECTSTLIHLFGEKEAPNVSFLCDLIELLDNTVIIGAMMSCFEFIKLNPTLIFSLLDILGALFSDRILNKNLKDDILTFIPEVSSLIRLILEAFEEVQDKEDKKKCLFCLEKLNNAIPVPEFVQLIQTLLNEKNNCLIKRKIIAMLNTKITEKKDAPEFDEFLQLLPAVEQLLTMKSVGDEVDLLKETCLMTLEILVAIRGSLGIGKFKQSIMSVVELATLNSSISIQSASLICLSECIIHIGAGCIMFLPKLMSFVLPQCLACLSEMSLDDERENLFLACLILLESCLKVLENFLSPYLKDIIEVIVVSFSPSKPIREQLEKLSELCATRIESRVLLPAIFAYKGNHSTVKMYELLRKNLASASKETIYVNQANLFNMFVKTFTTLEASNEQSVVVASGKCFVEIALKMNENMFKPWFMKLLDLSSSFPCVFYQLCVMLFDGLKGMFVPFFHTTLDSSVSILKSNCDVDVWKWIVDGYAKMFCYQAAEDAVVLSTAENSTVIAQVLVEYIASLHKEEDYSSLIVDHLLPCLTSLVACIRDDKFWKMLNAAVLNSCRDSRSAVKIMSLKILAAFYEEIREEFLILLPESIPFIAELLEDDDELVVKECRSTIKVIEKYLGESLDRYFE